MPAEPARVPIGRRVATVGVGALFGLLLFALAYPVLSRGSDSEGEDVAAGSETDGAVTSESSLPPSTALVPLSPPASGAFLLVTIKDGQLVLQGNMPGQEISNQLASSANATFEPFVTNQLAVNDQLGAVDWLADSPKALSLLSFSTNGSMLMADGKVQLSVQVSTAGIAERMQREIGRVTGLPVTVESMELTNLEAPLLQVEGTLSQLKLAGKVPTQEILDQAMEAASAVYGKGNVTSQVFVDENVHTALWMYNPTKLFEALFVFPEIDIQVSGETVTGTLRGGYDFASNSPEAIPKNEGVTGFVVNLMARDPSLQMTVTAHTDSVGDDGVNQELSQQRADYVFGLYTASGVEAERIEAIGKGETEMLANPEDTEEKKARNRRIEVKLTTLAGG